jgi:hypothetical protein
MSKITMSVIGENVCETAIIVFRGDETHGDDCGGVQHLKNLP